MLLWCYEDGWDSCLILFKSITKSAQGLLDVTMLSRKYSNSLSEMEQMFHNKFCPRVCHLTMLSREIPPLYEHHPTSISSNLSSYQHKGCHLMMLSRRVHMTTIQPQFPTICHRNIIAITYNQINMALILARLKMTMFDDNDDWYIYIAYIWF